MSKKYNEHSYGGQQMLTPIIKPHIQDVALTDFGITVETTTDKSYEFTHTSLGDEYLYPYSDGFQGGNAAVHSDKGFVLVEFKKETAYSKQKYNQRVQRRLIGAGAKNNDITGTAIARLEIAMHMQGVRAGVFKSFWLGDKSKTHTAAGRYVADDPTTAFAIGDPDKRYNATDGIWKEIIDRQASDNIPRVELSGAGASATLVNNGVLQDDAAKEIMKQCYVNASDRLKAEYDNGNAQFYVVRSIRENYQESLESGSSEAAFRTTVNGVERYAYRDIPLFEMRIQGSILKDFGNDKPFRVMLTTPENLGMVLGLGTFAEARYWFDENANQNRQRTQFEMEHGFILPELLSVAY